MKNAIIQGYDFYVDSVKDLSFRNIAVITITSIVLYITMIPTPPLNHKIAYLEKQIQNMQYEINTLQSIKMTSWDKTTQWFKEIW